MQRSSPYHNAMFLIGSTWAMASAAWAQSDAPGAVPQAEAKAPSAVSTPAESAPASESAAQAKSSEESAAKPTQLPPVHVNAGPSDDIMRSAREAGFKIKVVNGNPRFCKTEAPIGTRFASESCMDEQGMTLWLVRVQAQKDKILSMKGTSTNFK